MIKTTYSLPLFWVTPQGLIGLLLAVILSAAMSSTASELNALAATTTVDLYQRNRQGKTPAHYVKASKRLPYSGASLPSCLPPLVVCLKT